MRYGLEFQYGVKKAIEQLNSKEERPYTVREVLNFYIESNNLNPSKAYKKTLYQRVWGSLKKWCEIGLVSCKHHKHPERNNLIGYYEYKKEGQQERSAD